MRSKKIAILAMTGAIAVSSVAGCSRSKTRKIEGASDDAQKFIGVVEEVYSMKGISTKTDCTVSGVSVSVTDIVDKNNNYKVAVKVSGEIPVNDSLKIKVDDEVLSVCLIGNDLYLDISKLYDVIRKNLGEATVATLQTALDQMGANLKIEDMLVSKLSLGDIDRKGFSIDSVKEYAQKIADIIAVALTDTNSLKVDKDTYTVSISSSLAEGSFCRKLAQGIVDNKESLFDGALAIVDGFKIADNSAVIINKILGDIKSIPEIAEYITDDMVNVDEIKEEVQKGIDSLKDQKTEYLDKIKMETLPSDSSSEITTITFNVTDTKEGYSVSLDSEETGKLTVEISEYTDTISAPEGAGDGSIIAILAGVFVPQYLKYVEKSRISSDMMLAKEVKSAIQVVLTEETVYSSAPSEFKIYFTGSKFYSNDNVDNVIDEIKKVIGEPSGFKSNEYNSCVVEYNIVFDSDIGYFNIEYNLEEATTD